MISLRAESKEDYNKYLMTHISIRRDLDIMEASTRPKRLETTPLPYGKKDLEPAMSEATIDYHYEHLAKGYAQRYNRNEGNANFNRAGSYLHNVFFPQFKEYRTANRPKGEISVLIEEKFTSYEDFQTEFESRAMQIQGSGWIYLSTAGEIKTIANHAVRTDIALLVDWWEHAWALDYQSDKQKYLSNIWRIIDWQVINQRL